MPADLKYTSHRPKRYTERVPIFWWVKKWSFTRFILRELSAISVAAYAVVLILIVWAVGEGPETYAAVLELFRTPVSIALHAIAAAFVLMHTVTWFNLAPKAMVIKLGGRRVPPGMILAMNYAAWLVVSAFLLWLIIF